MEDGTYLIYLTIIIILSASATIIISSKKSLKKIYKYFPSIITFAGSIIFCVAGTILYYNRFIGILYVVVFIITGPGIILSLVIAIIFDIVRFINEKISAKSKIN